MKTLSILSLFLSLFWAEKTDGQTAKMIRDYSLRPITDTAYVYIEGKYKHKGDKTLAEIWQRDLQTGERWYSLCPVNDKRLRSGRIVKMVRKTMEFID